MKSGFIVLNKGTGFSSSAAVAHARHLLPRGTAIGHGGTLDPEAAGVLPLCVGKATRLFDYIIDRQKIYETLLRLGRDTDTQDAAGSVTAEAPVTAGRRAVEAALPAFTGDILQTPPMYSALKRDGKRLYELARNGVELELEPRPVRIDGIEYIGEDGEDGHVLRVYCHRGVYIRTLCRDIAHAVGNCGHMERLTRTQSGLFTLDMSVTEREMDRLADEGRLEECLLPMDEPVRYLPEVRLDTAAEKLVRAGNPVPARFLANEPAEGPLRLYLGDRFCGIGERDGSGVRFKCMLLEDE